MRRKERTTVHSVTVCCDSAEMCCRSRWSDRIDRSTWINGTSRTTWSYWLNWLHWSYWSNWLIFDYLTWSFYRAILVAADGQDGAVVAVVKCIDKLFHHRAAPRSTVLVFRTKIMMNSE